MSTELLTKLVDQIERGNPVDDHGHDFKMNRAFIEAKAHVAQQPKTFEEPPYRRKSWFDDDGQFGAGA